MKKMLKYVAFALAIALVFTAGDALAGNNSNVFATITDRMLRTFRNSRSVIFIVGGFGLIGLGFAAIFGKVNWKWLAALACGLAIVAVAGQVIDYVTQDDVGASVVNPTGSNFYDPLTGGTGAGYSDGSTSGLGGIQVIQ